MPESNLFNRRFVFLLTAQAGFGFAHSSFLLLPKFLATQLGAGPAEIGRVVAVAAISIVCFLIPAGAMVDRHGRKGFLIAGAALMALTSGLHVLVDEVGFFLYALRVVQSLAFAYAYAAGAALCIDAAPPARLGQAIGLFGLAYVAMGAFAPAVVETVVAAKGWNAVFLIASGAASLCVLLSIGVREDRPDAAELAQVALATIATRPAMRRALLVIGLLGVAFGSAFNFYQPYALSLGITELRDFLIANSLAAATCRLVIGPFIDRIGLRRVSIASLLLYAIVIFCMIHLDQLGLVTLGLGMGVAHGLFYPAYSAIILADSPASERGRRLSLIQASLNLGMGIGGIALGWVAARAGYPLIFELSAGALLLAGAMIVFEPRAALHAGSEDAWGVRRVRRSMTRAFRRRGAAARSTSNHDRANAHPDPRGIRAPVPIARRTR
jgi:MFS family permease